MYTDRDDQLNQLLRTSIEWLDITDEDYRLMVSRYQAIGASLAEYWDDSPTGGEVYPQGSMRLGTITRNIHRNDDIDIDLVARRDLAKASVTQAGSRRTSAPGLELFVKDEPEGAPQLEPGKRCWTLKYPGSHLDVLPACPTSKPAGPGSASPTPRSASGCLEPHRLRQLVPRRDARGAPGHHREADGHRPGPGVDASRRRCSGPCRRSSGIATSTSPGTSRTGRPW